MVSKEAVAACLAHAPPSLSEEELKQLEKLAMVLHFDADELVAQENAYFSGVYLVCQGLVYIGKYSPRTQEKRVLRFLAPGEWYGLEPFFWGRARINLQFARTIVESALLFFDTETFQAFLDHHPQALQDLCRWFAREVAMLEFKLTREATESADRNLEQIRDCKRRWIGLPGIAPYPPDNGRAPWCFHRDSDAYFAEISGTGLCAN